MSVSVTAFTGGYGPVPVVVDVDLHVGDGECVALLGRNGSGKTTLMRGLMGMLPTTSGQLTVNSVDLTALPTHARARRGLGYVPQGREIFPDLSVEENLRLGHVMAGRAMGQDLPDDIFQYFPWMSDRLDQRGGTLSGGQQQALAFARVLVGDPKVLLLDEPTEGLAPAVIEGLSEFLSIVIRERQLDVVLVEQNLGFAVALADRVYVLQKGSIVWEGGTAEVAMDSVVNRFLTV